MPTATATPPACPTNKNQKVVGILVQLDSSQKVAIFLFFLLYRNKVGQAVGDVQLSDLGLHLFAVVRFLDADRRQILSHWAKQKKNSVKLGNHNKQPVKLDKTQ